MTVSQLRDKMTEKVVPEKIMPQNIAEFLMDEDAELPELDAFTFLNRLRALGIGSADFLYLLSGCGAPEEAVEKVRRNPAMNLQSLILTLDGAGLTPQDYTRMLYTARQLWERTVTMRLEKAENSPEGIDDSVPEDFEDNAPEDFGDSAAEDFGDSAPEDIEGSPTEEYEDSAPEEIENSAPENFEDSNPDEYKEIAPEDFEDSPTEEYEGSPTEEYEDSAPEEYEESAPEENEDSAPEKIEDNAPEDFEDNAPEEYENSAPEEYEESAPEETDNSTPEEYEESTPEEYEEIAPEETDNSTPEETSEFRPVDMELLRQSLADAGGGSDEEPENEDTPDESDEPPVSQYHKGALITAAAGTAVLLAAAAAVGAMGFEPPEADHARFAADSSEVFAAVYSSYNSGAVGGEIPQWSGGGTLFGDIIVETDGSLGTFFDDGTLYSAAADGITFAGAGGDSLSAAEMIEPPTDTEFVYAQMSGGALYAVFGGAECGFVRIDDGKVVYTARQDGVLTDFRFDEETVRIGSVYTPPFTESFSSEQTECYLPSLGTGEKSLIPPENILLSGVDGCSYAVSACYSAEDGGVVSSAAALGYPVYSSADGTAFMEDGGDGLLVRVGITENGLEYTSARIGKPVCAAGGDGVYAAAEVTDEGQSVTIYDSGLATAAVLKNFDRGVTALRFDGKALYISGSDGEFMAADCSDAASPVMTAEKKSGVVSGNDALLTEKTADGFEMKLCSLENGKAAVKYSYTKKLTADEAATLETGACGTVFIGNGVFGGAYSWFDGVSVVSEYAVFGGQSREVTLFDDKTGFTAAFERDGKLCLVYGGGRISSEIHI
ncbi:MAG: hypothetical protein ACI4XA_08125 [Oscillospiraceae bacterium]